MLSTKMIDFEREEFLDAGAGIDAAGMLVMLRAVPGVRIGRGIGPADQHGEIAEIDEAADRDAGARPVLDRLHAGLEIEADGLLGRQRLQQRRLADARRSEDRNRRLVLRGRQALIGSDDPNGHLF